MQYSKRIQIICKHLLPCDYFADIGCDHGYCTEYMLQNNLCQQAIIADISEKSLQKAEKLLKKYLKNGKLMSVCCNGLQKIDKKYQQILIAGMGGEEIVTILESAFLPQTLILQPMKNVNKVRHFLLENGYVIVKDFTFFDKKYYDLLVAKKLSALQNQPSKKYGKLEFVYGYDNVHTPSQDFKTKILEEIEKYKNKPDCTAVAAKLKELNEVLHEINRYL